MLTPELVGLTTPGEEILINELGTAVEAARMHSHPPYRHLPYHNTAHIYQHVLPEALRLAQRDGGDNNSTRNRGIIIGTVIPHDGWSHVPLDPQEGFKTKEARTAALMAPIIKEFFEVEDAQEIGAGIESTAVGAPCDTPNERKVRRADLSNVGSHHASVFLANTVNLFYEAATLALESHELLPLWTPFLDRQAEILTQLIQPDLSIRGELIKRGKGPFNRIAGRNVAMLTTKHSVRHPYLFTQYYGRYFTPPLVEDFKAIIPFIRCQAGSL